MFQTAIKACTHANSCCFCFCFSPCAPQPETMAPYWNARGIAINHWYHSNVGRIIYPLTSYHPSRYVVCVCVFFSSFSLTCFAIYFVCMNSRRWYLIQIGPTKKLQGQTRNLAFRTHHLEDSKFSPVENTPKPLHAASYNWSHQ